MSNALIRTGLTLAGTIAGAAIGGPAGSAAVGAFIGGALGGAAGLFLFPPEGRTIAGRRLDDLRVSFSTYGLPIKILDGGMEVNGNYVWSSGLQEHRKEEDVGGGGFFGPDITQVTFLYTSNWRITYCEGVAGAILKNWADSAIIADITGDGPTSSLTLAFDNADAAITGVVFIRNFLGEETQLPGPAEQADKGIDNTGAYRGQVSQEYENYPLERHGNRVPNMTALVAMSVQEILPFKKITVSPSVNTQHAFYSADPRFMYIGTIDTVNVVDLVSRTVIDSYSVLGDVVGVDKFDRIWVEQFFTDLRLHIYEGRSGMLLATMSDNNSFVYRGFTVMRKTYTAIAISASGQMTQATYNHAEGTLKIVRSDDDTVPYTIAQYFPGSYSLSGVRPIWAFDSEDNAWLSIKEGSNGALIRFSDALEPVEKVVLTGVPASEIAYWEEENVFILRNGNDIVKYSLDSQTVIDTLSTTIGTHNGAAWQVLDGGRMYIQEFLTGNGGEYNVSAPAMIRVGNFRPNDWLSTSSNWEGPVYDPVNTSIIVAKSNDGANEYAWLALDRKESVPITVESILNRYSNKVALTPGVDMDASEQTDEIPAFITKDRNTARSSLEALATAFNFRAVESDWMVKFPKRGGAPIFAITEDDLGAAAGLVPEDVLLRRTRHNQAKLFETATITFIDPEFDWQENTQSAKRSREAVNTRGSLDFPFPGALGVDLAAQIIDRILWLAWAARLSLKLSVNWDFLLLDPGDVGTATYKGKVYQFEITKTDLGVNGVIRIEGMTDESVAHSSDVTGSEAFGHVPQSIVVIASTDFFILDSVLLRDQDDGPGLYVAAGVPDGSPFPGTQIFRSVDDTHYGVLTGVASSRAVSYGRATTILPVGPTNVWDRVNTLTIDMYAGALASDTEDNVLNGANTLLVGTEPGEVVGFLNATLNADGTTTVDTLLRGIEGSEFATGDHVANEDVLVLTSGTIQRVDLDLSDFNANFFYNAITLGSSDFGVPQEQVLQLISLKPRSPVHVAGTIQSDDWVLTAVRRTRIAGDWNNLTGFVPLGEASESYEWDIFDGSTVVRTLTSTAPTVTYLSADQVTDFSGNQTTLKFDVRQMSATVGRGFETEVTVVGA